MKKASITRRQLLHRTAVVSLPALGLALTGCGDGPCDFASNIMSAGRRKLLAGLKLTEKEKANMRMAHAALVSCAWSIGGGTSVNSRSAVSDGSVNWGSVVTLNSTSAVSIVPAINEPVVYMIDNYGENRVRILDSNTLAVLGDIPFDDGRPLALALSPDEKTLVAATAVDIAVVDTATRRVTGRFPLLTGSLPTDAVFHPDGSAVLISIQSGTSASLMQFDPARRTSTGSLPLPGRAAALAITPDGSLLFTANGTGVSLIDLQTLTLTATIPISGGPTHLAMDPSGARLFVGRSNRSTQVGITIVDTSRAEVSGFASLGVSPNVPIIDGIVVTPDGQHLYVWDNNSTVIYRVRTESAELDARLNVAVTDTIGVFTLAIA